MTPGARSFGRLRSVVRVAVAALALSACTAMLIGAPPSRQRDRFAARPASTVDGGRRAADSADTLALSRQADQTGRLIAGRAGTWASRAASGIAHAGSVAERHRHDGLQALPWPSTRNSPLVCLDSDGVAFAFVEKPPADADAPVPDARHDNGDDRVAGPGFPSTPTCLDLYPGIHVMDGTDDGPNQATAPMRRARFPVTTTAVAGQRG